MYKKSLGVNLISYFYIFGGLILLLTIFTHNLGVERYSIAMRIGIPTLPEFYARLSLAILSFIMAYGLLKFSKWGFWLFTIYNIYFFIVSSNLFKNTGEQLFSGNLTWSLIMLVYIFIKRKDFLA